MSKQSILHVVSFNIPYPPDYGGVIDVFYKVKALAEAGTRIILHTYAYGRDEAPELAEICEELHYYRRRSGLKYFFASLPYIVATRSSSSLSANLLKDKHPVLFEGLHSCFALEACKSAGKKTIVRTHNIEHRYYQMLARSERNLFRKIFLSSEAKKLKKYERVLAHSDHLISISTTDAAYFKEAFGKSHFVSAFHHYSKVNINPGRGDYILFHGNLSVPENESAILYLINKVLSKIQYRVIIAGKDPGKVLRRVCSRYAHLELIPNVSNDEMEELIKEAHINLLYTYQPTGLKLKLLHSLHAGRYCLTNLLMLSGSGLDDLCQIYSNPGQAIDMIKELMEKDFPSKIISVRKKALTAFENPSNADKIISLL